MRPMRAPVADAPRPSNAPVARVNAGLNDNPATRVREQG
jgi:hypothetical protein